MTTMTTMTGQRMAWGSLWYGRIRGEYELQHTRLWKLPRARQQGAKGRRDGERFSLGGKGPFCF